MRITEETALLEIFAQEQLQGLMKYCAFSRYEWISKRIIGKTVKSSRLQAAKQSTAGMVNGLQQLSDLAESGRQFFYPIYSEAEIQEDKEKKDVVLFHFPVEGKAPWVILVSGGGFETVCSMAEGFPVAAQINACGCHAFVLNYRVGAHRGGLMPRPIDDLAQAVRFIRTHADELHVEPNNYALAGFSAGGNICCEFCGNELGYQRYGLPKPKAVFPIYALTKRELYNGFAKRHGRIQLGRNLSQEKLDRYNVLLHAATFPPAYIVVCKDDSTVPYTQSAELASALEKKGISCVLELGEHGEHGFGDGSGTDVEGWVGRAVEFFLKQL